MKDGEKLLPKPIKAPGSKSVHLTSSASEGARRLKLEGLSKNRFHGVTCAEPQETLGRRVDK